MKRCPFCDQPIRKPRSPGISDRWNAHVTFIARELHGQRSREEVYQLALLKACEIQPPPGGDPYRYNIIDGVLRPVPTSSATTKEMMTACEALYVLAAEWDLGLLPEREDLSKLMEEME
jgi:hypothetical protein